LRSLKILDLPLEELDPLEGAGALVRRGQPKLLEFRNVAHIVDYFNQSNQFSSKFGILQNSSLSHLKSNLGKQNMHLDHLYELYAMVE
jgi:hypothetical protein